MLLLFTVELLIEDKGVQKLLDEVKGSNEFIIANLTLNAIEMIYYAILGKKNHKVIEWLTCFV